jgi:mannitol-specific phosphotransferase system IIBC component
MMTTDCQRDYNNKYHKEWRDENKDKIKEYSEKYRKNNKDKIKEYSKKYRDDNKDKSKEYQKIKITCDCGSVIRKYEKLRHNKSTKHKSYIENKFKDNIICNMYDDHRLSERL